MLLYIFFLNALGCLIPFNFVKKISTLRPLCFYLQNHRLYLLLINTPCLYINTRVYYIDKCPLLCNNLYNQT